MTGRSAWALSGWVVLAGLFAGASAAECGIIRITTRITVTAGHERVRAAVNVCNEGSAEALHVESTLAALGGVHKARVADRLAGGTCASFTVDRPISGSRPGTYPLEMVTRYVDAQGRARSAVHCTTVGIGNVSEAALALRSEALILGGSGPGRLSWHIENTAAMTRTVTATLFLPDELGVRQARQVLFLGPNQSKTVTFRIENRFAQAGGEYPVFCAFTHADGQGRHTRMDRTLVSIRQGHRWFEKGRWWVLAAGFFGLGVYALLLGLKAMTGRRFLSPPAKDAIPPGRHQPSDNIP